MAVLLRQDTGDTLELDAVEVEVTYPAFLSEFPVAEGVPVTDHRQRGLVRVNLRAFASDVVGGAGSIEAVADWLRQAEYAKLTLSYDDGPEIPDLVIGTWQRRRSADLVREALLVPLSQRLEVSVSSTEVTLPRADYADRRGLDEDGAQSGSDADGKSIAAAGFDAASEAFDRFFGGGG
jgi:hypothetical protein